MNKTKKITKPKIHSTDGDHSVFKEIKICHHDSVSHNSLR